MVDVNDRLGIEFISVLGMPPVQFIELAAELGCRNVGFTLTPITANPHAYHSWSLRDDAVLRRDTVAALKQNGVSISLGEGFLSFPGTTLADSGADLDLMCELGARRVNVMSFQPDHASALDELSTFAEMTRSRGIKATLEYLPGYPIGDLAGAMAMIAEVGMPDFTLLIDCMHLFRSGASVADVAALDPSAIGYVQFCDVPLIPIHEDYGREALDERLAPGEGDLPLGQLLAVIPRDVTVSLEVPKVAAAAAGIGPRERLAAAVTTTRAMLEALA